jgi:inorganic pyrophosphatase
LADPSRLSPTDEKDNAIIQVIIETPKGSRNKYAFDPDERIFELKKVLPAGMAFPYDFGFVPSTKAEDGDPIDVLVLMDEPAFPGCLLKCRPVGVIEGEQGKKGDKERNDRIVAIELGNHRWAHVKHIDDLGKQFARELEEFFVNYHELTEKKYKIIDVRGPGEACRPNKGLPTQGKRQEKLTEFTTTQAAAFRISQTKARENRANTAIRAPIHENWRLGDESIGSEFDLGRRREIEIRHRERLFHVDFCRHLFVQQPFSSRDHGHSMEPLMHGRAGHKIRYSQKNHALMMCHPA